MSSFPKPVTRLSLHAVKRSFERWREQCPTEKTIPDELWSKVKNLKCGYQPSHIYKTLGISETDFRHHVMGQALSNSAVDDKEQTQFVEVPLSSMMSGVSVNKSNKCSSSLSITRADGSSLVLDKFSDKQLSQILKLFLKG